MTLTNSKDILERLVTKNIIIIDYCKGIMPDVRISHCQLDETFND